MNKRKDHGFTLDTFDPPLTDRGYLVYRAEHEVFRTYNCHGKFFSLAYTAAILYLYGADFRGIHSFELEETHAGNKYFLKFYKMPKIYFTLRDRPLVYKNNQINIIGNVLKKSKYTMWYPYNWPTSEGDTVRNEVDPVLSKAKETAEMKKWNKNFETLLQLTNAWHTDFLKHYKNKYDFEFKLYKDDNVTCYFTIKDDTYSKLKKKEDIRERQWQYLKVFDDFARYLHKGFLEEGPLFPKCLYE